MKTIITALSLAVAVAGCADTQMTGSQQKTGRSTGGGVGDDDNTKTTGTTRTTTGVDTPSTSGVTGSTNNGNTGSPGSEPTSGTTSGPTSGILGTDSGNSAGNGTGENLGTSSGDAGGIGTDFVSLNFVSYLVTKNSSPTAAGEAKITVRLTSRSSTMRVVDAVGDPVTIDIKLVGTTPVANQVATNLGNGQFAVDVVIDQRFKYTTSNKVLHTNQVFKFGLQKTGATGKTIREIRGNFGRCQQSFMSACSNMNTFVPDPGKTFDGTAGDPSSSGTL